MDKGGGLANDDTAILCCVATWLINDYIDESHAIIQKVSNHSGSYWHGIVHHREGDFSNAKHWFRQAGGHSVLTSLGAMVQRQFSDVLDEKSVFILWTVQGTGIWRRLWTYANSWGRRGTVAAGLYADGFNSGNGNCRLTIVFSRRLVRHKNRGRGILGGPKVGGENLAVLGVESLRACLGPVGVL